MCTCRNKLRLCIGSTGQVLIEAQPVALADGCSECSVLCQCECLTILVNDFFTRNLRNELLPSGELCRDACFFVFRSYIRCIRIINCICMGSFTADSVQFLIIADRDAFFIKERYGIRFKDHRIVSDLITFCDTCVQLIGNFRSDANDCLNRGCICIFFNIRPALDQCAFSTGGKTAERRIINISFDMIDLCLGDLHRNHSAVCLYKIDCQTGILSGFTCTDNCVNREGSADK